MLTDEELNELARRGDVVPVAQEASRARLAVLTLQGAVRAKDELIAARDARVAELEKERATLLSKLEELKAERDSHLRAAQEWEQHYKRAANDSTNWKLFAEERQREIRMRTINLNVELTAARDFLARLEEVLSPTVLIGYAMNHPEHTRHDANMLKLRWSTLDKLATLFSQKSTFLIRAQSRAYDYRQAVEQEVRAWWAEAMGNLPGPALPALLERLHKLLPFTSSSTGEQQ